MMKVLVLGVGAQGSAAARRLDEEPEVNEIVCADYDAKAVESLVAQLKKGRGVQVDAHNLESIIKAAEGVDLIINRMTLKCTENVLEAALAVKAHYQDYAGTISLYEKWLNSEERKEHPEEPDVENLGTLNWYRSLCAMYYIYGPKFEKINRLCLFGTGSAPGLICAATKKSMRYLDSCETIYNFVWEGVTAKRFQPFWWSPVTALTDMSEMAIAVEDGKLINTPAFGNDLARKFVENDEPIVFREHSHDEPLQYFFNKDNHFKGLKNAYFKYAGAGMDFAKPMYEAGLLSHEPEMFEGREIIPFKFILDHIPPAPKYREEIQEIIDEGLALDSGCMVIEAYGKKDGKDILVETHVNAPGFVESFERAGMTAEMYLTGQGGYLFSKLFLDGSFEGMSGVISSDMITQQQVDKYFEYAAELGITLDTEVKEL